MFRNGSSISCDVEAHLEHIYGIPIVNTPHLHIDTQPLHKGYKTY